MSTTDTMTLPASRQTRLETFLTQLLEPSGMACEIQVPSGAVLRFGHAPPRFRVTIHTEHALRSGLDELALGRAYVEGQLEFDGDMLEILNLRAQLVQRAPLLSHLRFLRQSFFRRPTKVNRDAIDFHYNLGDTFYLSFIDQRYRFYSHGLFHSDDETLEESSEHKLETMFAALDLKPGMRLLDIGGGWGGASEYCGQRGVQVTSLTLADDSFAFLTRLINEKSLPCRVLKQDFLTYTPEAPYDAVVIYGVIEHIPNYRDFCRKSWDCLKPGGKLYMDASAAKRKYEISPFTEHYIWNGAHSFMSLSDILQEFLNHGFLVEEVRNETRDYELTMLHWARRFDAAREAIVNGWGEKLYRAFRVYLWGGCHAFRIDELQAYHIVVRKLQIRGPRPGFWQRARSFVHGLT